MTLRVLIVGDELALPRGPASSVFVGRLARGLGHAGASAHVICLDYSERGSPPLNTQAHGALGPGASWAYATGSPVLPARGLAIAAGRARARGGLYAGVREAAVAGRTVVMYYGRHSSVLLHLLAACRALGLPLVNCLVEWRPKFQGQTLVQRADDRVFHRALSSLDGSLVISRFLESTLRAIVPPSHRVLRVPVLADADAPPGRPALPGARPYALLCADFDSYPADARFALDAVSRVPSLDLVLVGKCEHHRQELLRHAEALGCGGRLVLRSEYVPDAALRDLYAGASALLAPLHDDDRSRARFPSKLADYLLAGVPVVSNLVGEVAEWLEDGVSAFLAPPDDPGAFAEALTRAVTHPERARVGLRGRDLAREVWDYRFQGARVKGFFEAFLGRG